MAEAERGWVEITLLNLLCCFRWRVSRVSMATHGLGNPPSSSRWGDDAAACLCRASCSPLCEPIHVVYLFPSDGAEQMMMQKCHALSESKMPPDCCGGSWFYSPAKGQSLNQMKHKLEHFDGVAILRGSLHNRLQQSIFFFLTCLKVAPMWTSEWTFHLLLKREEHILNCSVSSGFISSTI